MRSILKSISLLLVLFVTIPVLGQVDSIPETKKRNKPKFTFVFDARNSFLLGESVKMNGLKIGLDWNTTHRIGLGFYSLREPIILENVNRLKHKISIDFNYTALYYEYVFYHNKHWEFTVPVNIAGGTITLLGLQENGEPLIDSATGKQFKDESPMPVFGLSVTGQYKIWPWLGVGTGVGYRWALVNDEDAREAISAPIYIIKLKIFLGVIYRKVFPKKEKSQDTSYFIKPNDLELRY